MLNYEEFRSQKCILWILLLKTQKDILFIIVALNLLFFKTNIFSKTARARPSF
jgi:hypothetical protein